MKKEKLDAAQKELKEAALKDLEIQLDGFSLQEKQMEQIIELKIPERKARTELYKIIMQIKTLKQNIKIIKEQLKSGEEYVLEDKDN